LARSAPLTPALLLQLKAAQGLQEEKTQRIHLRLGRVIAGANVSMLRWPRLY